MAEFRARIRRVRMKNGGADVRVLDRKPLNYHGDDWRGHLITNAKVIAEQASDGDPLVGYVILGLHESGVYQMGWRYDWERARVPRMLFPSWIAELIRGDMIVEDKARDTFDDRFEWVE